MGLRRNTDTDADTDTDTDTKAKENSTKTTHRQPDREEKGKYVCKGGWVFRRAGKVQSA